jgi:diguanylate cyclase (GGDEF)-like protein
LATPLKNKAGEVYAIVESSHDITSLIHAQEALQKEADQMAYRASHDVLTGLPNRRLFDDRLDQAIARATRSSSLISVVFIDIDKFKDINDQLGHQTGDEVLVGVAKRLTHCLRASDSVARLGGDEFILLIEGMPKKTELAKLIHKIMLSFDVPIKTNAGPVQVSLSAGLSIYPQDAKDRKTMVRHADMALYDVKTHGRKGFKFFDELTLS